MFFCFKKVNDQCDTFCKKYVGAQVYLQNTVFFVSIKKFHLWTSFIFKFFSFAKFALFGSLLFIKFNLLLRKVLYGEKILKISLNCKICYFADIRGYIRFLFFCHCGSLFRYMIFLKDEDRVSLLWCSTTGGWSVLLYLFLYKRMLWNICAILELIVSEVGWKCFYVKS